MIGLPPEPDSELVPCPICGSPISHEGLALLNAPLDSQDPLEALIKAMHISADEPRTSPVRGRQ